MYKKNAAIDPTLVYTNIYSSVRNNNITLTMKIKKKIRAKRII